MRGVVFLGAVRRKSPAALLLLMAATYGFAQMSAPAPTPTSEQRRAPAAVQQPQPRGPLTQLYQQLGNVGLDPQRVWRIREAHLDRPGVHLTFTEGVIG